MEGWSVIGLRKSNRYDLDEAEWVGFGGRLKPVRVKSRSELRENEIMDKPTVKKDSFYT